MKHKTITYPSIKGEFVTLIELARLTEVRYSNLFFYQKKIGFLPEFKVGDLTNSRYKKKESIETVKEFLRLRDQLKHNKKFLKLTKEALSKNADYIKFIELADNHANEIEKQIS